MTFSRWQPIHLGERLTGDVTPAALAPIPLATGSQLLQRSYKGSLGRGLALAAVAHAAGLGLYWGIRAAEPPSRAAREIALTYVTLEPPLAPPAVPAPRLPPPATSARAASGVPEPVPDPDARPDQTIPAQNDPVLAAPPGVTTAAGAVAGVVPASPITPTPIPAAGQVPPAGQVFEVVEQMPEIIGGLHSIRPVYPELDRRVGNEGRVLLRFVVNEDGSVSDVVVTRGVSPGLDRAAVEAVQRARFRPGMQRGRAVKVRFSLPVNFRLN
jgi:protein TonB